MSSANGHNHTADGASVVGGEMQAAQQQHAQQQPTIVGYEDTRPCEAPVVLREAFVPSELLGCPAEGWCGVLRGLSPKLPVHMHFEPRIIGSEGGPPVWHSTLATLSKFPELQEMCAQGKDSQGQPRRARIKMRLSAKGKFVHRNRYRRKNIICCLDGEVWWLFIDSAGGRADTLLDAKTNDNWNGYRSQKFPSSLTVQEMHDLVAACPPGVTAFVTKVKAGDAMTFDGRWWHATAYEQPVLNMFFTPGKDMEVAVREHKRRMKMPLQEGLCIAVVNMAKCARLSNSWQTSVEGNQIDWADDSSATPHVVVAEEDDKNKN